MPNSPPASPRNFLTLPRSFDEMLAEARGYRLSLVLAHQHLAQLPRDLREGTSANARNKLLFNLSPEDARTLERHVAPKLSAHDLSHLGAYTAAARLIVDGAEMPAFTVETDPPQPAVAGRSEQVRAISRARYGQPQAGGGDRLTGRHLPGGSRSNLGSAMAEDRRRRDVDHGTDHQVDPGVAWGVEHGVGSGVERGVALRSEPPQPRPNAGQRPTRGSHEWADSRGYW